MNYLKMLLEHVFNYDDCVINFSARTSAYGYGVIEIKQGYQGATFALVIDSPRSLGTITRVYSEQDDEFDESEFDIDVNNIHEIASVIGSWVVDEFGQSSDHVDCVDEYITENSKLTIRDLILESEGNEAMLASTLIERLKEERHKEHIDKVCDAIFAAVNSTKK